MIRLATVIGAVAAPALALAALASTGAASASTTDDMFISVLSDEGLAVPPTPEAIGLAQNACSVLDTTGDLVDAVNAVSEGTGLGTEDSAFHVGASVATYCPQHAGLIC